MMRINERVVRKDGGVAGVAGGGGSSSPYLDRSKVRILLCDNDPKSSREAFTLLCKCSYQVTSVRTPRQVIDALNAEGPDIDIILAEVDLPVAKGLKMLKYITRDEGLRRIPIIMMSAQDDVSVVVKCLKLGAADYLVKPLRTNELLNLWTHMWRRRHMLGLSEKKILNHDFDVVASDPSDANTNSTTLFSDDTDEKSRRSTILENSISDRREDEFNAAASVEPALNSSLGYHPSSSGCHPCVLRPSEQSAQFSSYPKKSELRIGESSAFFTYVKAKIPQGMGCIDEGAAQAEKSSKEQHLTWRKPGGTDAQRGTIRDTLGNYHYVNSFGSSDTCRGTSYAEMYRTPLEFHHARISKEEHSSTALAHIEPQVDASDLPPLAPLPYYMPGMMNHVMLPPPSQVFQGNQHDFQKHAAPSMLPTYNYIPHGSNHVPMVTSFPFYPICLQTAQTPPPSQFWSSSGGSSSTKAKPDRIERREAALIKFRQKRKDRCFDKKIRYINRKRLAERRPRVRGQFVRQVNGVDVDLNGQPIVVGDSDEDLEDEEEEFNFPR